DVEAVHLIELVVEVAEHEADQALGLFLPAYGGLFCDHGFLLRNDRAVARNQRDDRQRDGYRHHAHGERGDRGHAPNAPLLLALLQRVEADVEHAGDQPQLGVGLAILAGTRVCGDRFGAFGGRLPVRIELETQRGAEALFRFAAGDVEGIRFATDDQAEDAVASAHALPSQHFLVDPARRGRRRRADHDQVFRLRECCVDLLGQAVGAGEFVAIAEDRIQAARDRAVRSLFADQPRWHAIGFQRLVQPVRPRLVAVAVADERTIGEAGDRRLGHATPPALDAATHRPWLGTIVGRAGRWRVATIPYGRIAGPKLAPNVNRVTFCLSDSAVQRLGHPQQFDGEPPAFVQRPGTRVAGEHRKGEQSAAVALAPFFGMCEQGAADAFAVVSRCHGEIGNVAGTNAREKVELYLRVQEADRPS